MMISFHILSRQCFIQLVVAGRICRGFPPPVPRYARFGFYWFFYVPRLCWNGGRFGRNECVDVTLQWLRWSLSFTAYQPTKRGR